MASLSVSPKDDTELYAMINLAFCKKYYITFVRSKLKFVSYMCCFDVPCNALDCPILEFYPSVSCLSCECCRMSLL